MDPLTNLMWEQKDYVGSKLFRKVRVMLRKEEIKRRELDKAAYCAHLVKYSSKNSGLYAIRYVCHAKCEYDMTKGVCYIHGHDASLQLSRDRHHVPMQIFIYSPF